MLKTLISISALVTPGLLFPAYAQATVALQEFTGGSSFRSFDGTNMTVGWSFTANENLTVNSLGFWDETPGDPLNQSHQVGLWNSSGTLLSSTTVNTNSPLTGDFRYESITPLALTSGEIYFLGAAFSSPFSDDYVTGASSITTAPEITFNNTARNDTAQGFSFPEITGGGNGRFGPNFQFQTAPIPEPLTILGVGTAIGFGASFKRQLANKGKKQR